MLDDHKYSRNRIVAYAHRDPEHTAAIYGPGGPERTYGLITEIHLVEGELIRWEYTIRNSFTGEVRRVREDEIFHGANQGDLDLHRRDAISWAQHPPEAARNNSDSKFWKRTLRQFVRTAIPKLRQREQEEEAARRNGRRLPLGPGDYIKVRGDLRQELEPYHNMYAKVLSISPASAEFLNIPHGRQNVAPGKHRVLLSCRVQLDDGNSVDIYDVEVGNIYTTHGRTIILNWRAATFLAEAFGDDPPYEVQLEYLNGHVFTRADLVDMSDDDLADLLARLLYVKGMIIWEELPQKAESLSESQAEYLVDQILAVSRFNMAENRPLTQAEIERMHHDDARLRELFERPQE